LRLLKYHPFAIYGVVAVILFGTVQALNLQYDGSGIGAIVVILMPVWGVVYWGPHELLYALNDGKSFFAHTAISAVIGFTICLLADYFLINKKKRDAKQE
jgi:hypothetical protein